MFVIEGVNVIFLLGSCEKAVSTSCTNPNHKHVDLPFESGLGGLMYGFFSILSF